MYPTTFTELTGLFGILIPFIIATFSGWMSVRTKRLESELVRWRRINELAATLYNKDFQFGLWAQLAAAHQLGEVSAPHRGAAKAVLVHSHISFAGNIALNYAIATALARINRCWLLRALGC